ncbi:MAG: hypothetical protein L0219_00565 [Phycisphaerales bacterium]|nr:hypothetical protein [Phycisphaerales bacterium]
MFVLQNTGSRELHLPGVTVSELEFERISTKFDLSLTAAETFDGLRLDADYNTDLFDAATVTYPEALRGEGGHGCRSCPRRRP